MKLAEYLRKEAHLSEEEIQLQDNLWDCKELPKGYQLVKEGSYSKKVVYIEKGLIRAYYIKDGKDITHHFFSEKMVYMSIENVFLNQHQSFNLELIENSKLRTVDYSRIEMLIGENVKLQRLVQFLMTSVIKELAERLRSIQFQSAQDRYKILLENYPDILLRAPLGHIASYLGITQQTLSVIRAEKSK